MFFYSCPLRFVCLIFVCLCLCILGEGGVHFSACFVDTKNNNKYMSADFLRLFALKGCNFICFSFAFFLVLFCSIINVCVFVYKYASAC